MSPVSSPSQLRIFWQNVHQWDLTARGTGLHVNDAERRRIEIVNICGLDDQPDGGIDVVCFGEVWSRQAAEELQKGLGDRFQHWIFSPFAEGVPAVQRRILERLFDPLARFRTSLGIPPTLLPGAGDLLRAGLARLFEASTPGIVGFLGSARYGGRSVAGLLDLLGIDEERLAEAIQYLLSPVIPWGGGLMIGSKHPLKPLPSQSGYFIRHPVSAGLERQASKGSLAATVEHPTLGEVGVVATHLQDGIFPAAIRARTAQMQLLAGLKPAVLVGDFNIVAETLAMGGRIALPSEEYRGAKGTLGLRDGFRDLCPDAIKHPGFTYDHRAGFAKRFGVVDSPEVERTTPGGKGRIDYTFYDPGRLAITHCAVLDFFDRKGRKTSDHSALLSTYSPPPVCLDTA